MAVNTAMAQMGGIGWGIIKNILMAAGIGILCMAFYFGYNFIQKTMKKQKAFTIEAIICDLNGVIEFDMLAFVKNDENGMLEMELKNRKGDSLPPIPKHMIKNNKVFLLNYAPGHYCVIDTSETLYNLNKGLNKIIPLNLGMKKYIINKQREFLNKADSKKAKWDTYAPWITLGVAICSAILFAWALFYFGIKFDNHNISMRIAECQNATIK